MQKQFGFTSYTTEEIDQKIDYSFLEKLLNTKLQLSEYGSGIEKVYFVFIAVPSENINHDEEISFKSINKRLLIRKKMSYETVLKMDKLTIQKEMAQTFFFSLLHVEFLNIESFKIKSII